MYIDGINIQGIAPGLVIDSKKIAEINETNENDSILTAHLLKNEQYLVSKESPNSEFHVLDGEIDESEIKALLNNIDGIDGSEKDGSVSVEEIEAWKEKNNAINAHGPELKAMSAQAVFDSIMRLFFPAPAVADEADETDETVEEITEVKEADETEQIAETTDEPDVDNIFVTDKELTFNTNIEDKIIVQDDVNPDLVRLVYEKLDSYAEKYPNLKDNMDFLDAIYVQKDLKDPNVQNGLGRTVGGYYMQKEKSIYLSADFGEEYLLNSLLAHEFAHSIDYHKDLDGEVTQEEMDNSKNFGTFSGSQMYKEAFEEDLIGIEERITKAIKESKSKQLKAYVDYAMQKRDDGSYRMFENFATMVQFILEDYTGDAKYIKEVFPNCYELSKEYLATA